MMDTQSKGQEATLVLGCALQNREELQQSLEQLLQRGLDLKLVSIFRLGALKPDTHKTYTLGPRILEWSDTRALWNAMLGFSERSGMFGIGGLGTLMVAGPATATLVSILEARVKFAEGSAMELALQHLGLEPQHIQAFEKALRENKYLLLVCGSEQELLCARSTLELWN